MADVDHPRLGDTAAGNRPFIVSRIAAVPVEDVVRSVIPYFMPLTVVLLLLAWFPQISLWLPNLIMGPQ